MLSGNSSSFSHITKFDTIFLNFTVDSKKFLDSLNRTEEFIHSFETYIILKNKKNVKKVIVHIFNTFQ